MLNYIPFRLSVFFFQALNHSIVTGTVVDVHQKRGVRYPRDCFDHKNHAFIRETHIGKALTRNPENLNVNAEILSFYSNDIENITSTSLYNYPNLTKLQMDYHPLYYIFDGAFDRNSKLQKLTLKFNRLRYIPADFGPATHSLNMIKLYRGMEIELTHLDFSRFSKLKTLITGVNPKYKFPASNLPQSLNKFVLNVAYLTKMTNFSRYTPNISIVNLGVNNISTIKEEFIQGLHKLRQFSIGANRLHAIPDLYDKPLEILQINGNPIRCDVSLCWVRLWARTKLVSLTGADPTVCHIPQVLRERISCILTQQNWSATKVIGSFCIC